MSLSNTVVLADAVGESHVSFCRAFVLIGVFACCLSLGATERAVFMPVLHAKPFGWLDANGQAQGLCPDIAATLARQTGLVIRVEVVPFARAAALVAAGSADGTMMFRTAFTQGKVVEAAMVFDTQQLVQMRPGLKLAERSDLAGLDRGRMNGGCQELGDDSSFSWHFQKPSSPESRVRMLLAARIDGFCAVNASLSDNCSDPGWVVGMFCIWNSSSGALRAVSERCTDAPGS